LIPFVIDWLVKKPRPPSVKRYGETPKKVPYT